MYQNTVYTPPPLGAGGGDGRGSGVFCACAMMLARDEASACDGRNLSGGGKARNRCGGGVNPPLREK